MNKLIWPPLLSVTVFFSLTGLALSVACGDEWPRLADDRLQLKLFAEEPDIVTPIGMAIDAHDHVFVIESHTHHPPDDYAGPKHDRIKRFVDRDNGGKPDHISIFADGIRQAMNLAFSPRGELYVVCAREVLRLVDEDRDGRCDRQDRILTLVTRERYAHNSLLGITFDREGWMYVSRGNLGSHAYRFEGADETTVEGYGDGGNIIRCRPDGTQLSEVATGFWNPFDLKFDRSGRLLLVDNDPDARGPNRLVHVVSGGDYGYKSLYGGGGNHPFQGWDGTLPGTLPFIAGTGEAPSGIIDCRRASFPTDYEGSVLATIWNENSIERFALEEAEGTLRLRNKSRLISGSKNFRPVALDCDSRGNLFITDWVLVNYPNHGRGRIWRVNRRPGVATKMGPQAYFDPYLPDSTAEVRNAVSVTRDAQPLIDTLCNADPFSRHAAIVRLAAPQLDPLRQTLADHTDPQVRLGSLLATKMTRSTPAPMIRKFLVDADETVRRAALMWAGQTRQVELRPQLELALTRSPVSGLLFETYLAAAQNLDEAFVDAFEQRRARRAKEIPRPLDVQRVAQVAQSDRFATQVRGRAIRHFDDAMVREHATWLVELLHSNDEALALAAMRRLASESNGFVDDLTERFADIAFDEGRSSDIRGEALLALSHSVVSSPTRFLTLLDSPDTNVAIEAARTLHAWLDRGEARDCVAGLRHKPLRRAIKDRLSGAIQGRLFADDAGLARPQTNAEWHEVLGTDGDAARGRRVFFSTRIGCAKCHTVDGRGGVLGPDLSRVAQSKKKRQIVDAILDPSAEYPPQYQAWIVLTTDGREHRGLQLDHKSGGAIALITENGDHAYFTADEIESYDAVPSSLMPSGLAELMSVGEFRDLVAFLEAQR